jgi:hypothetical protein
LSHKLIKEKLMSERRTCHLPNSPELFCISIYGLGQAKTLQRQDADIVFSSMTEMGGWR